MAVGGKDADALQREQGTVVVAGLAPVAVAPQNAEGQAGMLQRGGLGVAHAVAEEDGAVRLPAVERAAQVFRVAVGIGKNSKQHFGTLSFPPE